MLLASHKNVEVNIADEKAQYYISLGYKITDMNGKVIYDPVDNTDNVKGLKEQLNKKDSDIKALEAKVKDLNEQLQKANDALDKAEKTIEGLEKDLAKKTSVKK